jgi:hypothetical protein
VSQVGRLVAAAGVLALAACVQEPLPPYVGPPAPPPLQPYMEPPVATPAPATTTRTVKRRYVTRRHHYHRVRCRCLPVQ